MTGGGDGIVGCGRGDDRLIPVRRKGRHLVVDIHCHFHVAAAEQLLRQLVAEMPDPLPFSSPATKAVNGQLFARIGPRLGGIETRIADMDALGVDVQAISPSPGQYYYSAPPDAGREVARSINDGIANAVATHPDRLVGMGTVPLQDSRMAIEEMRRCVRELGFRGIEINSNVNGEELAAERLRPFFAAAEELGVLLFLHPLGFTQGQRLSEHYLDNIIGNPLESSIALAHLIFGGVLSDHRKLKLCVAHGGGYLPAYWGRMDHAFHNREDCRQHISEPPSSFLRNVWLDTLVFDRRQLDHLIEAHGADRLCLGTDYPFDMGEADPVGFHAHLPDDVREKILGGNAASLLGLRCACSNPD